MTQNLEASQLSLNDVCRLLKLEEREADAWNDFFYREPLSEFEQQQLLQISNDFWGYLEVGKV
ncbi:MULTISPECIES: hypothetical protein [Microcoleaceae]|uniref:hypothetical protein n=1 Tax=Microcoleaceae TaxID=1892252 RepID=UPI001D134704|nr:hypothetical protein [Tychonema sp. LEGE 06208]